MIYVLLAEGFEEIEAIAPVDVMRRNGLDVKTASIGDIKVRGSHSVVVEADMLADDIKTEDVEGIILPGGLPGTTNLQENKKVTELIEYCKKNEILLGAICAAPMILGEMGILNGKDAVCFPGFEKHLIGANLCDNYVVTCENVICGRGAGAALEFGAAIVDYFSGRVGEGRETLIDMQYPL